MITLANRTGRSVLAGSDPWSSLSAQRARVAVEHASPADAPPDLTAEDWDDLFRAVGTRLAQTVGTLPAAPHSSEAAVLIQASVLECVEALGQLHSMLAEERNQRERLEQQVTDLRHALALALAELVGSSALRP